MSDRYFHPPSAPSFVSGTHFLSPLANTIEGSHQQKPTKSLAKRVALVCMPFASIRRPSIALGLLKRALHKKKIEADILHLNLRMAKRVALERYETISGSMLMGEYIFSQHLFGEFGSGELQNSLRELKKDRENYRKLTRRITGLRHMIEEIVPQFIQECIQKVSWENYGVVGFTSMFAQHVSSLLLAKKIKEICSDVRIVFGGANVQGVMGAATLSAFEWIDYVVNGEAEESFPLLVQNLFAKSRCDPPPGVSYRNGADIILDSEAPQMVNLRRSPVPDYSEYFRELNRTGISRRIDPFVPFEGSRGCWWGERSHCTFCGLNGQLMKYRSKSPHRILRELLVQSKKYNARSFEATDTILQQDAFQDLVPLLAERNPGVEIFYEVKSNLSMKQIEMLRAGGINEVQPGIESLHTEILKLMRKGVSAIQNLQMLKWCRFYGISTNWNILYGFPGEARRHYDHILSVLRLISHLEPPDKVARIVVQRFSPYHNDPDRFGISLRPDPRYRYIYPEDKVNLEDLAFTFAYSFDSYDGNPEEYIRPVLRAVDRWNSRFKQGGLRFTWRIANGKIEIEDERNLIRNQGLLKLTGLAARIYAYCDTIRSFQEVVCHTGSSLPAEKEESQRILTDLVRRNLIYAENDHYLSLALPAG